MEKQNKKTEVDHEVISWWEDRLTSEERRKLLPQSWSEIGDREQRHKVLLKLYNQEHSK
jgi:hypothetical protein